MSWGKNLYDLVRIPIRKACAGYYLRWYYNGWHYWFFLPGEYVLNTNGEKYRTISTRYVSMSSGQITLAEARAIRTIMNTREVYLLTVAGWMNIRIEPGSVYMHDSKIGGVEVELTAVIGSKEVSFNNGYSPVPVVPYVPPVVPYCDVVIGDQVWMCKNYDSDYPGSKAYNDDLGYAYVFGRLYNRSQILSPGFCPAGYHVPTYAEWLKLIDYCGGNAVAGGVLKQSGLGLGYWNLPNTGAVDTYGFTARGAGIFNNAYGIFESVRDIGQFWCSDSSGLDGWAVQFVYNSEEAFFYVESKDTFQSVRLIKDTPTPPYNINLTTTKAGVFSMTITGAGSIFINWGDGTSETNVLNPSGITFNHAYAAGGNIVITASGIKAFTCSNQQLTSCVIPKECVTIEVINVSINSLTVFDFHKEWRLLTGCNLWQNQLTVCNIPEELIMLVSIDLSANNLGTFVFHEEWINISALISLDGNAIINAADVDAILIAIDNSGIICIAVDISGGTNAAPTAAGIIAKNNLIAKGIVVNTN